MSSQNQNPENESLENEGSHGELLDDARTVYRAIAALLAVTLVLVAAALLDWWLTRTTTGEVDRQATGDLGNESASQRFGEIHRVS